MISSVKKDRFERWMEQLPEALHDVPICKLAIPGSHESCTYYLRTDWEFSPDAFISRKIAPTAVQKHAKCQDLSIQDQLNAGIRYLDFRVAFRKQDQDFYFCHSLYGPKVSDVLGEVSQFLDGHEKEVVLLDFTHVFATDNKDVEKTTEQARLGEIIEDKFSDKICQSNGPVKAGDLTLRNMLDTKKQVIVFYGDKPDEERLKFWPSPKSARADTMDVDKCLNALQQKAHARDATEFYVNHAVLTPRAVTFLNPLGVFISLRDECAAVINPRLKTWMVEQFKSAPGMIHTADFVNTYSFIENVLSLNSAMRWP